MAGYSSFGDIRAAFSGSAGGGRSYGGSGSTAYGGGPKGVSGGKGGFAAIASGDYSNRNFFSSADIAAIKAQNSAPDMSHYKDYFSTLNQTERGAYLDSLHRNPTAHNLNIIHAITPSDFNAPQTNVIKQAAPNGILDRVASDVGTVRSGGVAVAKGAWDTGAGLVKGVTGPLLTQAKGAVQSDTGISPGVSARQAKNVGDILKTVDTTTSQAFKDYRAGSITKNELNARVQAGNDIVQKQTGILQNSTVSRGDYSKAAGATALNAAAAVSGGVGEIAQGALLAKGGVDTVKNAPEIGRQLFDPTVPAADRVRLATSTILNTLLLAAGAKRGAQGIADTLSVPIEQAKALQQLQVAGRLRDINKIVDANSLPAAGGTTGSSAGGEALGLPAPKGAGTSNASTRTTPGVPATPTTVPVSETEYNQRFNAISKSHDQQSKAIAGRGPLAQKFLQEQIDQNHVAMLDQLTHEYQNGKPNPDFRPAIPSKTEQTGFVMGKAALQDHADALEAKTQTEQVQQRIGQIDKIINDSAQNGTHRPVSELRSLMQERVAAQDVLDGKRQFGDVYSSKPVAGATPSIGVASGNTVAQDYHPGNELRTPQDARPLPSAVSSLVPTMSAGAKDTALHASQFVASKTRDLKAVLDEAVHTAGANGKPLQAMTPRDQKLLESIETNRRLSPEQDAARIERIAKTANNPGQFRAVVQANQAIQDRLLAGDRAIPGREDTPQIANHLPRNGHTFVDKNGNELKAGDPEKIPTGDGTPGYTKQRVFPTIAEKEAYAGPNGEHYVRNSSGVIEDIKNQIDAAAVNHGGAQLAKGLKEAFPDQVSIGRDTVGAPRQLNVTGADHVYASKKLATEINSRAQPNDAGKFGRGYDAVNQGAKTFGFMGGLFHGATTATSVSGEQLLRGITHPTQIPGIIGDNLKLIGSTFSPRLHEAMNESFTNNHATNPDNLSTSDRARLFGVTETRQSADFSGNVVDKLTGGKYNPLGQAHEAVFGRQIPDAKLMIFDQATKGLDSRIPADRVKMEGAARAVNKLGNLNKLTQGMTPTLAKWFGRVWISPDYTQGRLLTWKSAVSNFKTPEGTIARNTLIGKTVVSSLAVLSASVATGQLNPTDSKAVRQAVINSIEDPSFRLPWNGAATNKANPGGTPQAVHLPTTFISEFTKIIMPALQFDSPDRTQGVKDYLSARLAKLPGLVEEGVTNSDYFGNPIYGNGKDGNPIGAGQTALNVINQVAPIPAVQASKSAFSGQNVASAFLNTAGLRVGNDKFSPQARGVAGEGDHYNAIHSIGQQRGAVVRQINKLAVSEPNRAARLAQEWNDSLPNRIKPLQQKYPHYDPSQDQDYGKLKISPKSSAIQSRVRNSQKATKTLQSFY